ncbi:hypothetical protein HO173_012086 [Letharia columbiana]|uniref:Uncharacterized protein n=1 Tax=Letharia columbiana TaxID=112416 RepID=A0A8H6FGV2_9LECA|nr:uncharacterized protein HO173_012086 [Letharia columbiana]KAF6227646.1 hypothetical protein HO173_012086 [Letharia columbiana]
MATYIHLTEDGPSATADAHLEDTETVFWSNLEGGLSLLAVNLPSLWAIIGKMSSPASQLVASIRSALSLRSFGSGSHHSSNSRTRKATRGAIGGGGVVDGANKHSDESQVRIHETIEGQSTEWHRLRQIDSQETDVNAPRVSNGTDYDAERADNHSSMV